MGEFHIHIFLFWLKKTTTKKTKKPKEKIHKFVTHEPQAIIIIMVGGGGKWNFIFCFVWNNKNVFCYWFNENNNTLIYHIFVFWREKIFRLHNQNSQKSKQIKNAMNSQCFSRKNMNFNFPKKVMDENFENSKLNV